jgi:hypothetical protein
MIIAFMWTSHRAYRSYLRSGAIQRTPRRRDQGAALAVSRVSRNESNIEQQTVAEIGVTIMIMFSTNGIDGMMIAETTASVGLDYTSHAAEVHEDTIDTREIDMTEAMIDIAMIENAGIVAAAIDLMKTAAINTEGSSSILESYACAFGTGTTLLVGKLYMDDSMISLQRSNPHLVA